MIWTSEKPTSPGTYRFRRDQFSPVRIMVVQNDLGPGFQGLYVTKVIDENSLSQSARFYVPSMEGEWSGPLGSAPMKYTTEKPSPGRDWYWMRHRDVGEIIVQATTDPDGEIIVLGQKCPLSMFAGAEFAGPLEPPR